MKEKIIYIVLTILTISSYVYENEPNDQEDDAENLEFLLTNIKELATSESCTNADDWDFVAIGSKPCGGPWEFMPYPTTIDTAHFIDLVEQHKTLEHEYNITWGMASDCATPSVPSGVSCVNGEPVLEY